MKICILGAGVIGLTTAWELVARGHEVIIVDRQREPGAETSFANAGQLAYTHVAPLASPEMLRKLPEFILDPAASIRIRPSLDPAFCRWCLGFLAACSAKRFAATVVAQLALAALSRDVLEDLATSQNLAFSKRTAGKLLLYRKADGFERARKQVPDGQQILASAECLALEPSLRLAQREIAGGFYTPAEQVGDCHAFCVELADRLRRKAVTWHMETRVHRAIVREGTLRAVATDAGDLAADLFVLALGSDALHFAHGAGFRLPIYPIKGYSITAQVAAGAPVLTHSVTDYDRKMAYAPLVDASGEGRREVVRVTGGADLVGFDRRIDAARISTLTRQAEAMLALDLKVDLRPWAGLRPSTPDGRPIIGWSPIRNLFLNVGQGSLGWTLACGSARLAAELIEGAAPSVRPEWFALRRAA